MREAECHIGVSSVSGSEHQALGWFISSKMIFQYQVTIETTGSLGILPYPHEFCDELKEIAVCYATVLSSEYFAIFPIPQNYCVFNLFNMKKVTKRYFYVTELSCIFTQHTRSNSKSLVTRLKGNLNEISSNFLENHFILRIDFNNNFRLIILCQGSQ